jgi:hypothetical protein
MNLPYYAKVKDKYAIYYLGRVYEYVVQLVCLMPNIKKALPSLEIDVFCKDEVATTIGAKPLSSFQKHEYGFTTELTHNLDYHPVEKLLSGCNIQYKVEIPIINGNIYCSICADCFLPSKPLTSDQVNKAKEYAKKAGYTLSDDTFNAGWVIGPESYALFLAASRGLKTSLVPTGLGANLYKAMFPLGEILKL